MAPAYSVVAPPPFWLVLGDRGFTRSTDPIMFIKDLVPSNVMKRMLAPLHLNRRPSIEASTQPEG